MQILENPQQYILYIMVRIDIDECLLIELLYLN
jgi:hypothetical protein